MTTSYSIQFANVETPPFEERFRYRQHGVKVECVLCGKTGFMPSRDNDHSWAAAHREHVRCTCGKAVTSKGIAMHRAARKRHGNPCPPIITGELP